LSAFEREALGSLDLVATETRRDVVGPETSNGLDGRRFRRFARLHGALSVSCNATVDTSGTVSGAMIGAPTAKEDEQEGSQKSEGPALVSGMRGLQRQGLPV
jgi:hypothetical protein